MNGWVKIERQIKQEGGKQKGAAYWRVCLQPRAQFDPRLRLCLSYLVWLMALPCCSHSHRSISLVQYSLDQDHLAQAQKAQADVQTLQVLVDPKNKKNEKKQNKAKPQNKTKKIVLVERCAKACQARFHNIQRKELFFLSLFLKRQENAKGFGRLSWTHAANSEEKRSSMTKHLRIIRHTRNSTAAPSNFCSASVGQILPSHNMSNRMSCLTMGRHSCLISRMYWPSVCLKEILLYEACAHLTDCTLGFQWIKTPSKLLYKKQNKKKTGSCYSL